MGRHRPGEAGGAGRLRRAHRQRGGQDLRGGRLPDRGPGALLGARARRPAGHRPRRVLRVRGGGARRSALAGGHAQARGDRLRPDHDRPVVGGELRPRGRGGPAALPDADLDQAEPDRQRLRPTRGQRDRARRPERDEGARGSRTTASSRCRPRTPTTRRRSPGPAPGLKPIEIRQPEGPSFELDGPRAALAEVAHASRVHAARGPGAPHGELPRPGARAADPPPGLGRRHGGPVRRPAAHLLPPQRVRRGRVRHRVPGQLPRERLRLPRRDPVPGRRRQRQPGRGGDAGQRHLRARGGLRHPLEALRLADGVHRGPALAPARGVVHRHRGQLRVRLLLVLLPGRDDPARGEADRHRLQRGGGARRDAAAGASWWRPGCTLPSTSTSSTCGST